MNTTAVQSNIESLRGIFTIVIALAIGEAFKQFIVDRANNPAERHVQWDRLPALLSFLFLIIPFYHGMVRYFYEAYNQEALPHPYGISLSFDCLAFTLEAILFFVLSRSLCLLQWRSFYGTVWILNCVDLFWILVDYCLKRPVPLTWIVLDLSTLVLIGVAFLRCNKNRFSVLKLPIPKKDWFCLAAIFPVVILFLRTTLDYTINYSFYFPSSKPSATVSASPNAPISTNSTNETRLYFAGPLFTQAQWRWNDQLAEELRKMNFNVTLPQDTSEPMLKGQERFDPKLLYRENLRAIDRADIVLAILDEADPDSGTCWECGYAFKSGRPVVGLRTDIRGGGDDSKAPINLMLSQSCKRLVVVPYNHIDDLSWVAQKISESIGSLTNSTSNSNQVQSP
ncbi:MAG TPA: nucleoside 2-deoxyribosyltransferase [Candidatus Acidoferrales bacterium]|jgi:nucleoside 2-deoxyribosyltransferase|nr:nucleoside 2-deoxyribosyltransferase [Candidatus Acidoferrales bacterium]